MTPQPRRHELTDEQWEKLEPLLPPQKPHTGRPNKDHRTIINGLLWIMKTGAQWEDLPERYGSPKTVSSRLYRWRKAGIWDQVLAELQRQGDTLGEVQWTIHYVDGTSVRAHQSAAGAKERSRCKKGDPESEALGRSRGGFGTKIHVRCEGKGKPVCFVLTPGQQNESTVFEQLMELGSIKRAGRGRPRRLPGRIVGDKGYSSNKIRLYLRRKGINYTIPRKSNQTRPDQTRPGQDRTGQDRTGPFNKAIYRQRNRVERLINRLKHYRRIATRYEKRADNYRAFLTIAAILLWL